MESLQPLKVDFRVPAVYLRLLEVGQPLRIRVDAFPDETFTGTVYAIDPRIDVNGRAVALRATIPNEDGRLRPGLFARVTLVVDRREDAIIVPEQAIVPRGDEKFVRSEEHTSELQSLMRISYAVFCLKKKKKTTYISTRHDT